MNFCSDNASSVAPEIIEAIVQANQGFAMPYGEDDISARLEAAFSELFETAVAVFPVATGTAANVLALSSMSPPYGAIYCHRQSHIHADECGAPEFFTGGAKLVALDGAHGKLHAGALDAALLDAGAGVVHHVQPAAVSITQASEAGTIYSPHEIREIAEVAGRHGLAVHMDGARLANAVASLNCAPADITWRAGVDALSFGATKNGAMAAEAVVFFRPEMGREMGYRRKRGGHLVSKMRYVSAQLLAIIEDNRWLAYAAHANRLAARLAEGLTGLAEAALEFPVEANEVFIALPDAMVSGLRDDGFRFYSWGKRRQDRTLVRLVTAFDTRDEDVEALIISARRHAQGEARKET
jgi:threonine aldolase